MASYRTYTVVWGDTLSGIAARFGTSVGYLASLNGIPNANRIYVGQVLKISEIVTVSPSKPNPAPAPAPKPPSTPSNPSPVSNNARVTLKSKMATITAFGLQSDTDRTFFATWTWDGPYTDRFEVRWFYRTANNVKFTGHSGSVSPTDNSQPQSVYNAPSNAIYVSFQVKPIAQTHKVNNSDVEWWTAEWSTEKVYNISDLPPAKLPNPVVSLEDYTLKMEVTGIPDDVTEVEFQVIQNDTKSYKYGTSKNVTATARYSCSVSPGYDYKVRCRAIKKGIYGVWTDYTKNVQTKPSKPAQINEIRALSETSLTLNWSESTNAETYELEHATKLEYLGMSNASTTISGITGPRYIVTGLGSGEKYFIRVRAVNAQGKSDWTEAVSIILGAIPAAPTTWSSTSTAIVGEEMKLYWMHNSKDGSKETIAELQYTINNEAPITEQVIKTNISDDVSYYYLITRTLTEGALVRWKVRTAGVTGEYGLWSATRMISIYAPPSLSLTIREDSSDGSVTKEITRFPFYIVANAGPSSQTPIGYHLSVISRDSYETVDNLGNVKMITAGQEIMSKFYDINDDTLVVEVTPGDIDLENNCQYDLQCMVTMDSGLTEEEKVSFKVSFEETEYFPTAEILFNSDTLSTHIRPYCTEKHYNFYEVESTAGEATYGGTTITANNTIEAPIKSAIISGNTLVNTVVLNSVITSSSAKNIVNIPTNPNKKYLLKYRLNKVPIVTVDSDEQMAIKLQYFSSTHSNGYTSIPNINLEIGQTSTIIVQPMSDMNVVDTSDFIIWVPRYVSGELDIDILFIEYQEGMENWDIPYFEGMCDVKMPVLTTTGKNLFSVDDLVSSIGSSSDVSIIKENYNVFSLNVTGSNDVCFMKNSFKENTQYTFSWDYEDIESGQSFFVINYTDGTSTGAYKTIKKVTSSVNKTISHLTVNKGSGLSNTRYINYQIEENIVQTSYEPYKSNTLSTPSDLVLRGIGDVKDTLDVNTGEVVQRIGEVIFDGSEAWTIGKTSVNTVCFQVGLSSLNINVLKNNFITNYLIKNVGLWGSDVECATINGSFTHFQIRLNKTKASTVDEVKQYLNQNPLTVHLELASPIIKTVDLSIIDQDNNPVNWMSAFKDTTHISSTSGTTNSLIGELDVTVKTKDTLVSYNRTNVKIDPLEGISLDGAFTTEGDLVFVGVNSKGQVIYFAVKESTREYLVENVTLSVYRQDYDGRFITIATDIENLNSIYVTDPHPPLNYANYRIVVTDKITGSISYVDIPPYEIGVKSVIIQWGETWENLTVLGQDPVEQIEWAGSMLKLPYNIDVSDSNTMDVSLVEYIGRAHPVSYYGTQLGVASTWNVDIPKYDTNTLYGLRLLSIYAGDVYVREPSGSGYWANISVSFSQKHRDLSIPVTLDIKRVDGNL